jgi:signal transduction histidine kinase
MMVRALGREYPQRMSLALSARLRRLSTSWGDVALITAIAALVTPSLVYRAVHGNEPWVLLLLAGAIPPLFLRNSRPLAALLLAIATRAVLPGNETLSLPVLAVLYTIASRQTWTTTAAAAGAVIVASVGSGAAYGPVGEHGGLLGYAIASVASTSAAVALGLYGGARARVVDGLRERAERAVRENELLAERAVAEERLRIAQELHDVVGHNVSLMVVQAQALGVTSEDERVAQSTRAIADLGRQAMAEMHRTLTLLRAGADEPAELAPQPGLADLDRLLEQSRAAGIDAELAIQGEPRALDHTVELSAFRIVQEALTNVIKHAAGARAKVTLSYRPDGLTLTIADNGDGPPRDSSAGRAEGHGVIGMRERAGMFGGTLAAGPRTDRGFEVIATLPYSGADA